MVFDAEGNMWCGQNWLAGSQSGVRKSIGGGLIKFSPNGTSLSPAITGFTGWEWTASGGVRPWHSTKSGSGHPEIAHGVQSDSASADRYYNILLYCNLCPTLINAAACEKRQLSPTVPGFLT